jgi:hypothetical protein
MGNIMSASFAPECTEAKKAYDNCFNEWYSESECKPQPDGLWRINIDVEHDS